MNGIFAVTRAGKASASLAQVANRAPAEEPSARQESVAGIATASGEHPRVLLHREVYRSRRFGRALALVGQPVPGNVRLERLKRSVREVDAVWSANGYVYILAPETDRQGALQFLARLVADPEIGITRESARVAVFPDDALTVESLIRAATLFAGRR